MRLKLVCTKGREDEAPVRVHGGGNDGDRDRVCDVQGGRWPDHNDVM